MIEYSEDDIEKVSVAPLVHNGDWVDPANDQDGAEASLVALVGVPVSGDIIAFDGVRFVPSGGIVGSGGTTSYIDDLLDVNTTGVVDGDTLIYSSGMWVPGTGTGGASALDELSDVNTSGVVAGDVLVYSSGQWVPISPSTLFSGASYIDEQARDAVGAMLTDTARIDFTYNDALDTITADIVAGSIGPTQLAATAVTAGTYGDADTVLTITVDADGRLTNVTEVDVSGSGERTSTTFSASTAAAGQSTGSFSLAKGTVLFCIEETGNRQCRVRLYGESAARDADVARDITESAVSGSYPAGTGLTCDVVLASNTGYALNFDPKPIAGSPDDPPVVTVYYTLDNLTDSLLTLEITLRHTPIET